MNPVFGEGGMGCISPREVLRRSRRVLRRVDVEGYVLECWHGWLAGCSLVAKDLKNSTEQKGEIARSVAGPLMKVITAQGTDSDRPAKSSTL